MGFITDKQTLDDLNIFGSHSREKSIYGMFNRTTTNGGAAELENMFRVPLSDHNQINLRSTMIRCLMDREVEFPFRPGLFNTIDHYLSSTDTRTRLSSYGDTLERKFRSFVGADTHYSQVRTGVLATLEMLYGVRRFIDSSRSLGSSPYDPEFDAMEAILGEGPMSVLPFGKPLRKIPYTVTVTCDTQLRFTLNSRIKRLLRHIYTLDAYISVAKVARQRGFAFAAAMEASPPTFSITDAYHPQIPDPVPNSITIRPDNNMVFLTGANMAGKSTFMKTMGVALFLAHMGFPVPAASMEFSVKNGMFTTINLADNLSMGYSHFYIEVLRVKKVAEWVNRVGNLVVVFDELFRGTNVKDAYDATIAVTEAFSHKQDCIFVISTHIIEAGEVLGKMCGNMDFIYMPTEMEGSTPTYPYKFARGITCDRHGMIIVRNEGILDILDQKHIQP